MNKEVTKQKKNTKVKLEIKKMLRSLRNKEVMSRQPLCWRKSSEPLAHLLKDLRSQTRH